VNLLKFVVTPVVVLAFAAGAAAAGQGGEPVSDEIVLAQLERGAYPVKPTAIMERRKINGHWGDMFSENSTYVGGGDWPEGGFMNNIGLIARHPFEGANALYQCISKAAKRWNYFTSNDKNCEGHSKPKKRALIGYLYAYHHPGTSPLYRCRQDLPEKVDHFDSTLENCEGYGSTVNEGILGYLWAY
jgi:hypothetical protein